MSEERQAPDRGSGPQQPPSAGAGALATQPASFWIGGLASIGAIIGGVGPWATLVSFYSISGTSMHGWREVGVGAVALVMLAWHRLRGALLPLLVTGVAGALGATLALTMWSKINSGGAVTVLGVEYRYLDPAWGLYLVLVSTITLVVCSFMLALRVFREIQQSASPEQRDTGRRSLLAHIATRRPTPGSDRR